jgi:5-methylcytosine-specific restriction endonuclease McrA
MKRPAKIRFCAYCSRQLTHPKDRASTAATRDHIVPQCQGGRKTVPCCRLCNHLKGDMSLKRWREVMRDYPGWWKRFKTRGELLEALRQAKWAARRVVPVIAKFPAGIVPPPPLCRGLAA